MRLPAYVVKGKQTISAVLLGYSHNKEDMGWEGVNQSVREGKKG